MKGRYTFAFAALTSLFFIWGFITVVVDAFIPRLREVFELSYGQAGLVQVAWFLAYLGLSIPGGIIVSRIGYKKGIVAGLVVAGIGCLLFFPAASYRVFGLFLLALFVLAGGITFLQVSDNPFVADWIASGAHFSARLKHRLLSIPFSMLEFILLINQKCTK